MTDAKIEAVALPGSGTIGSSWASFYATKGLRVKLYDSIPEALEQGLVKCRNNLKRLVELGLATEQQSTEAAARVQAADSLEACVGDVQFVHESVVEKYEIKKPLFTLLDSLTAPDVIIASSSSGLLISELQTVMKHPERALIAHPFNPPHLVPLVELVSGNRTDPAAIESARVFFEGLGKVPVVLNKEVPGHIANRLAAALWREAIDLVASGVASVEDVDKALYAGPGLRWAIMGQHQIYHLGGGDKGYAYFIQHIGKAFEEYWRGMAAWTSIPEDAKAEIVAGVNDVVGDRSVAEIANWRDEKLAGLLKVLYDA